MTNKSSWISQSFQNAAQDPLKGFNTQFIEKLYFPFQDTFELAKWNFLARRIITFLSDLPPFVQSRENSSVYFGKFVHCVGHVVTASLLEHLKIENTENYVKFVQQEQKKFIQFLDSQRSLNEDFSSRICRELRPREMNGETSSLSSIFSTAFTLHATRHPRRLEAITSQQVRQDLIASIKTIIQEVGLIDSFEPLTLSGDPTCPILDPEEMGQWVRDQINEEYSTKFALIQARAKISNQLDVKINEWIEKQPTFALSPLQILISFLPDSNKPIDIQVVVDPTPINQAREEITPQLPRIPNHKIKVMQIGFHPVQPLEESRSLFNIVQTLYQETQSEMLRSTLSFLQSRIRGKETYNLIEKGQRSHESLTTLLKELNISL